MKKYIVIILMIILGGCSVLSYIAPPKNGDGSKVGHTIHINTTTNEK